MADNFDPLGPRRRQEDSDSEAVEENVLDEAEGSSEGSGENLSDLEQEDYRAIPELDTYEQEGLSEGEYDDIENDQRRSAEDIMEARDMQARSFQTRQPTALLQDSMEQEIDSAILARHRAMQYNIMRGLDQLDIATEEDDHIDMEEAKGMLSQWIKEPRTIRMIKRHFTRFLKDFTDESGHQMYIQKVSEMCNDNKQTLVIDYEHLSSHSPVLALWVADEPGCIFSVLNEVAHQLVLELYHSYGSIFTEVYVRISNLPISDTLRKLRHSHLNKLIKVSGVVTRRTSVFPQLKVMVFFCTKCGERKGPIYQNSTNEVSIGNCGACQSKGPFTLSIDETIYRNFQKITIQETPGTVPPGRVPRHKEIILLSDLIDCARPGEEIEVTGIYTTKFDQSLNAKHGFPVFATVIEANLVRRMGEGELSMLTEEQKYEITQLAKDPNIASRIIDSIAPSIYGHKHIKTAIAMSMFGGMGKDIKQKHKIRGDINVLLLGDPGVAKSQFLKYIKETFYRCVYTTGKGASAVGLTAGVHRDPVTKEWALEGGALVLADKGICLIDEFDKMNEHDRTSIHESMEQQSISISKAGIVTSLQARCAVIAAANPIKGKYDSSLSFAENVDLTEPILSRFDCLCVVKDEVDLVADHSLATFVLNSHIANHPNTDTREEDQYFQGLTDTYTKPKTNLIPQSTLKAYIMYARQFVRPKLADIDQQKISNFYTELRSESQKSGGINIAVRHVESLLRMAEAHARMHLRDHVRNDDVDAAISMLLNSFLQSQKYAVANRLIPRLRKYIVNRGDYDDLLFSILNKLFREKIRYIQVVRNMDLEQAIFGNQQDVMVTVDQFENEARENGIHTLETFFNSNLFM